MAARIGKQYEREFRPDPVKGVTPPCRILESKVSSLCSPLVLCAHKCLILISRAHIVTGVARQGKPLRERQKQVLVPYWRVGVIQISADKFGKTQEKQTVARKSSHMRLERAEKRVHILLSILQRKGFQTGNPTRHSLFKFFVAYAQHPCRVRGETLAKIALPIIRGQIPCRRKRVVADRGHFRVGESSSDALVHATATLPLGRAGGKQQNHRNRQTKILHFTKKLFQS